MTPRRGARLPKLPALFAALAAIVVAASLSFGSSHREAPNTSLDPTGDNTDVYAFTADDAPGALTVVANWIPFEDPAGGPNFYKFDPKAHYYIKVDNTGDGKADVEYLFQFRTQYRNPKTFLYGLGGKVFQTQTYSVTRSTLVNGRQRTSRVIARNVPTAPNNVGPKTFPNYSSLVAPATRSLIGGGKVFAGQREDPFFVDLGATFDAVNLRKGTGNEGAGKDDLAGYNVHSIVLQIPEAQVTANRRAVSGPTASNAVVGVWSTTERRALEVTNSSRTGKGRYVQVSRLANPLVNELVVPVGLKDQFNRTTPDKDAQYAAAVLKPELAADLNALFHLGIKETNRTDIVTALLTGVPGATQIGKHPVPADTLKLNLGIPPTAQPNRFGFIGGDKAGFPDGRRLGDDVVDIELRVVGGFLLPASQGGKKLPLGDGVDSNDKLFSTQFPYVASPTSGFDSAPKRTEPPHAPTSADTPG